MAITLVASTTATPGANGGTTTGIDTTGATLIIVGTSIYLNTPVITDNLGNTYVALTNHPQSVFAHRFYYALAPAVGPGHTVTAFAGNFYPTLFVYAFAGVGSYHSESGAGGSGFGGGLPTGPVTPSADGALVVTGFVANQPTASLAPAGFTVAHVADGPGHHVQGGFGYLVQTPAAAINPTWTVGSIELAVSAAVFLPAVSPGPEPPEPPPVYEIGIGETTVVPLLATFRIQETIDAPDTMIADVFSLAAPPPLPAYQARILADGATAYWPLDDPAGSTTARDLVGADDPVPFVRFSLGQAVVVTENGVRIFGGVVTGTRERGLTGPSATDLVVEVQATSYELSAARRVITAAISQDGAETIGAAFATLVTDYYAEVGVSLHPSQVAGPALPAATFTRSRGDAVNKHLAASVGYLQSIDFENRLRAWAPGDVLAPANYDESVNPELLTGDVTVERQLQNGYANRVILTGDPIPVPGHVDHFTGDGVTNVWPVTYVVNGPYPYFVDGAVAQGVIQYPATSTTESIGGVESPPGFLWEYDPIAHTIHRRGGPVAAGVAFDFPYDGLFIPAGMAEDAAEIAALGLWEHVENVTAVITDVSAQGYADALLAAKVASKDEIVRLQTRALGFHPGQTMTIASFSRLLAGDYLITQVDTGSESGGILLVRSITASKSQNNTHDWRRVYQQWAGASAQTETSG